MKRSSLHIILVTGLMAATLALSAQRRITPVNNAATMTQHINENASTDSIDRSRLVEMPDANGNIVLVDTVTGKEFIDSALIQSQIPKMMYPLLYSASVSVNIYDALMRAFGQEYGLFSVAAEVNLHNRYIPVFEFGFGQADYKPDGGNFTYRSPMAPFFRIGANYNIFYNSDPKYQGLIGVRYGFTPFTFSVDDITQAPGYWDEELSYNIPSQAMTAGYGEVFVGLRVNLFSNFSLGWTFGFHMLLHESSTKYGEPWYIPGYGTRDGSFAATFSAAYTFKFKEKKQPNPLTDELQTIQP